MTYREMLEQIFGLARFGMKPGLARITPLLKRLGDPQKKLTAVHVVGTNGKGSTSAFLSSILHAAGYRTGLFTSPHLVSFTERIRIDGKEIGEDAALDLGGRVLAAAGEETTFFEVVTAMALLQFAQQGVDVAVVEAGMGGRKDATAAVPGIMTVVTPVSLDHTAYLGSTEAEIAREKIGIAERGTPVVVASQTADVLAVLRTSAEQNGSRLYAAGADFFASWSGEGLNYNGLNITLQGMHPGLFGEFQAENAAAAICAAEIMNGSGLRVEAAAMAAGIAGATWPGRMEFFGGSPRLLLDGAHNAAGAGALARALAAVPRRSLVLVVGVTEDKDADGILAALLPLARVVITVSAAITSSMPSGRLAGICRGRSSAVIDAGSVAAGLEAARTHADPDDIILVCGSLFVVGETRALLLKKEYEPVRG